MCLCLLLLCLMFFVCVAVSFNCDICVCALFLFLSSMMFVCVLDSLIMMLVCVLFASLTMMFGCLVFFAYFNCDVCVRLVLSASFSHGVSVCVCVLCPLLLTMMSVRCWFCFYVNYDVRACCACFSKYGVCVWLCLIILTMMCVRCFLVCCV